MRQNEFLKQKTEKYKKMLDQALKKVKISVSDKSHLKKVSDDFFNMANAYYNDGLYFIDKGDMVNALACFSYGYGWIDAGVRLGIFITDDEEEINDKL